MNIEEKAKRYDEVMGRAKKELDACGSQDCDAARQVFRLFPELKESEDEEVRKEIMQLIQGMHDADPRKERWLAWLEKQNLIMAKSPQLGEQKPADKVEPKFKVKYAGGEYNVLEIKRIAGVTYYGIEDEPNHIDYVLPDNCEIVSEQKPTDKIEPKFKVGDVVCDKSCTILNKGAQPNYEIVGIRNGMYFCDEGVIPIEHQDQFELVAKKVEPKFHEKDWSVDDYLWQITAKEQLDVLYTKIKEAGYEWDDEKKEFKKIKNPAWSEKDEAVVKDICDKLSWLRVIYTGNQNIACQKDIYWLKSLKGRVGCEANFTTMWKPSEKQIMCLQDALSDYHRRGYKAETLETLLKQLKQL